MYKNAALRKIVLAVFLLAVALALAHDVRRAEAVAGPFVCAYYSDATYTTVVGARGTGCCNTPMNWGITTPYKVCQTLLCPDVICPD